MNPSNSTRRLALLAACAALASTARADLIFTQVFTVNKAIPDLGELADSQTVSFGGGTISEVAVGLRVDNLSSSSPAWSGDYYAGLGHGSGYATLLNRIGTATSDPFDFGSGHEGVDVTFSDAAAANVHDAPYDANASSAPALTGSWKPDGRNPAAPGVPATLASFNTLSPDGAWELLLADDSAGGTGKLVSWSLSFKITPDAAPLQLAGPGSTLTIGTPQTLANDIVNQGTLVGPTGDGQAVTLTGDLTGAGGFQGNFILNGTYSPGNSPAAVTFDGDTVFGPDHVLTMEIGGTAPGTEYDTIAVTGLLTLDGALNISFIDGYVPSPGDSFQFFTATSFGGGFAQITFSSFGSYVWDVSALAGTGLLTLVAVPEPSTYAAFAGLAALGFVIRRRRQAGRVLSA